jgi:NADPH-dependent 2,4-dienoyl-CoA reductase/sulfur reductase-like enzyme/rhodanese-related sulfurtransferase
MNRKQVLIIGASACGAKAASRIKRLCPAYEVTMLEKSPYLSYAACGMPYRLEGKVRQAEDLMKTTDGRIRDAQYFRALKDIAVHTNVRASKINRRDRHVEAIDLQTGRWVSFPYDALVLAMGGNPKTPPIPGMALKGVYHLSRMEDMLAIIRELEARPTGAAVVVGGGFIGIEMAQALRARKWSVTVIERENQLFPNLLDDDMAAMIREHFFERMVDMEFGAEILSFEGKEGRISRVVTQKTSYAADLVIVATGLAPDTKLAQDAGLTIGETGAVKVNRQLQTSDPAIYAGGDLVENTHLITGAPCYMPMGSTANKHGRVIADNICGRPSAFPGVSGTFICKAFEYAVGATGLTASQARQKGFDALAVTVCGFDKAHYYPSSEILALKVIVENKTGKLLGVQAVGKGDVARRIDVAATAIRFGASVDDLDHLDLAYAPPFSQALDIFLTALYVAQNVTSGLMKPIRASEVKDLLLKNEHLLLLDVRSALEFERAHVGGPHVINIPLDELRQRGHELPKDKKIVCVCLLGLRGFSAQRILEEAGYPDVHTLEGGLFLWPEKEDLM